MDAQAYIDEMRAKKRRNLIIGAVIALILAAMILPGLFGKKGPDEEDLAAALAKVPELALTWTEQYLADTILKPETFRNELTYDAIGTTTFELEEVRGIIGAVLPENAQINAIGVQGAVVYIDYQESSRRVVLEYIDPDRSGSVDQIRKTVSLTESGEIAQISYDIRTGKTSLLKDPNA